MTKQTNQTIEYLKKLDKQVFQQQILNQFACECGKLYKTFPALYLHFQRSHNIIISTKFKNQHCRVSKIGNIRTFTYFYDKMKGEAKGKDGDKKFSITSVFQQFLETIENQMDKFPALYLCQSLGKYLNSQQSFQQINSPSSKIFQIPNYFNGFIMQNEQNMRFPHVTEYNKKVLLQFSRWLNIRNYSSIKVQCQPIQEQGSLGQAWDCVWKVYGVKMEQMGVGYRQYESSKEKQYKEAEVYTKQKEKSIEERELSQAKAEQNFELIKMNTTSLTDNDSKI